MNASRLRLFGVGLICAKLALVPVVFDYSLDSPFTVAKALLSHALGFALLGVLVALAIRWRRAFVVFSPLDVPVLAFLGANVAATLTAADQMLALYGAHGRMLGLGTITDWVILYFGLSLIVRTRASWLAVLGAVIGGSVPVLAYELIQLRGVDPFRWNMDSAARPFSTIGQPTTLGLYLTTLAFGALALGVLVNGLKPHWRGLLIAYAAVLLVGAVATGSRSSLLGVVAGSGTLILLLLVVRSSKRAKLTAMAGAFGGLLILAALVVATPLGSRLAATIESSAANDGDPNVLVHLEPSATGRIELYGIALQMLRDRPLLGYGPDNFAVGVVKFRAERAGFVRQGLATSGHSWLSNVATGSGSVGLVAFLCIIAVALLRAARSGFAPIPACAVTVVAAFLGTGLTTISDVGTDWLFWLAIGAIAARSEPQPSDAEPQVGGDVRRSNRAAQPPLLSAMNSLAIACVAVSLLPLPSVITALDASRATRQSQDARLVGNAPQAIEFGLRATRADPRRAEYWHDLGLAYVGDSRWAEASDAFERASALAPYDQRHIGDFARAQLVLALKGDSVARSKALELAEVAIRVDPNNPLTHLTRAVVMQATGNLPDALGSVRRALDLDPQSLNGSLYSVATQVMVASGQGRDAIDVARLGIGRLGPTVDSVNLRIELARALVTFGQPLEALIELDTVLAIQPGHATATRLQAEIRAGTSK